MHVAPDPVLDARVHEVLREKLAIASELYNREFEYPTVVYKSRGTNAGTAYLQRWEIELQVVLMNENGTEFVDSTVTHELAHLIDYKINGRQTEWRGRRRVNIVHGPTWKRIMVDLGENPERTHSYDVSSVRRHRTRYVYQCNGCGQELWLGSRRHEKMQSGKAQYWHRSCKRAGVTYIGVQKPESQRTAPTTPKTPKPSPAPKSGGSKRAAAALIFKDHGGDRRSFIEVCIRDLGMKQNTASTYHHNFKSGKWEV